MWVNYEIADFGGWVVLGGWLMGVSRWLLKRKPLIDPDLTVPCPSCGYNMRGLTHTTCPECGTEYRLEELMSLHRATAGEA